MTETLQAGRFYTMGKMKHACGDRSYTHDVWEIVAENGTHAVIRAVTAKEGTFSFGIEPRVVLVCEFDWTPADELVSALSGYDGGLTERTKT